MDADGFHDLLRAAQATDSQALERLLTLIRPHLEQVARGYADPTRPDASTSDLVQEAWLRAWQKLDQFQGAEADDDTLAMFRAWVGQIVRSLGLNAQRERNAQRRKPPQPIVPLDRPVPGQSTSQGGAIDPAAGEPTPSVAVRAGEQAEMLRKAIEGINDQTARQIVEMRFFDGLSLRQISQRVGLSYDKVRERYQATMGKLERELGGLL
jgi:RNA polymerase sigma-70 factor (ECF subfamily)